METDKLLAFFRELNNRNVDYVLVGAVGLIVHGIVRATQDLDIFMRPEESNVAQMRDALKALFPEDQSIDEITAKDLAGEYPAIRYNSPDGSLEIDILSRLGQEFTYEGIRHETKQYEGVPVRVATPEMLYEMKKNTVRLRDRADAEMLKELFGLKD